MKIRSDFVSNSSSSSYIVATKESIDSLIDHIVEYAKTEAKEYNRDIIKYYWPDYFDDENRMFLENRLGKHTALILGTFAVMGSVDEDGFHEHISLVVDNGKVKDFVENGEVKVKFDDVVGGRYKKCRYNDIYNVYEITQDTIDFTRWFLEKSGTDGDEHKALSKFYYEELTHGQRCGIDEVPEDLMEKWDKLSDECNGLVIAESIRRNVKTDEIDSDGDPIYKTVEAPLSSWLDELEAKLKNGNRLFRICFGSDGEGTDWDSYVWTDGYRFKNERKDKYDFEYDPCW